MSKECPKCKTTNYDSATICSRCGNVFADGSYYIREKAADIKTQKKRIDKSAKILILIIAAIICLIVFLLAYFIINNTVSYDNDKNTSNNPNVSDVSDSLKESFSEELYSDKQSGVVSGFQEHEIVDWDAYIPVEEIKIDKEKIELEEGQNLQLQATVLPKDATNKGITWQSSNEDIVTIENGFVTAKSEGTAQVYAIGENDKHAVCNVTVKIAKKLVEPDNTYDYGNFTVTADTFLSMRFGPSTEYDEISRINKNEIVRVYAYTDDENGKKWAFIEYKEKLGWVYDRFLDEIPEVTTEE